MKKITLALLATFFSFCLMLAPVSLVSAGPVDVFTETCKNNSGDAVLCSKSDGSGVFTVIKQVIQVMLVVAGIIAVIMIIVGGIKYTTSNGDQAHVKSAKDTILYSVIGLVVAIISYAIVTYVVINIK